ncbi:hypothetical protein GGI01_000646 [Coemansia sp. RSA 376]|nr:hypothetical protein GGI14_000312 [Coemansia sp. S680]KAJ2242438.1 hypothetical protein GGI13_006960 [Coemansia sp. RSA 455]KAJ2263539.1 hypothetical protein GGI01_000646 [Coemansia sp. RSA 376]
MKLYSGNRSAGMLPATVSVAFVLMLHLARSELVPTTVPSGVDQALATGEEHAYHWWDVFSSNAADLLNNMLSDVGPDKYSISDAAEKAGQAKEGVEYLGIRVKDSIQDVGHNVQQDAAKAKEQAQNNVEYVGARVQDEAGRLGHVAKQEAADAKQQAREGPAQAAKRVKHVGQAAHDKAYDEGSRAAQGAESTGNNDRSQDRWLRRVYCRLADQVEALGSVTRGASNQLRSKLKAGLYKLNDLANADAKEGGDSTWPESVVAGASQETIMEYVQGLNQMSQHAHAQLKSKLEAQEAVLKSIAGSYVLKQLPLAGFYGPLAALMLIYLVGNIWSHRADICHRMRQRAEAAAGGAETTRTFQEENVSASEAVVDASVHLAVVPMVIVLLVIMELNGSPSWLVIASYTCLLAGMLVTANPVLLASIWSGDDMGSIEQRLAVGILIITAMGCLVQTMYG